MPLAEVRRGIAAGFGGNSSPPMLMTTMGHLVVVNFYQAMILDGHGFQVRAGTITTPLTGDGTAITDAAAEMCADCASGTTIMPIYSLTSIDTWTADDSEGASKSVATVSSAGAAFVPLPLKSNGVAAVTTARVAATGGVTVTAELATTTLVHFMWHSDEGGTPATDITSLSEKIWDPIAAPVLVGARCFYVQVSLATYFAHFDYLEMATLLVNPS